MKELWHSGKNASRYGKVNRRTVAFYLPKPWIAQAKSDEGELGVKRKLID